MIRQIKAFLLTQALFSAIFWGISIPILFEQLSIEGVTRALMIAWLVATGINIFILLIGGHNDS